MNESVMITNNAGETYTALVLAKGRNKTLIVPCEKQLCFPTMLYVDNDMITYEEK